jgi:hypothetical protein
MNGLRSPLNTEEVMVKVNNPTVRESMVQSVYEKMTAMIERVEKIDAATAVRLNALLTPDIPTCQGEDTCGIGAGSEFFSELILKINMLDDRIDNLETTLNRIEV